LLVHMNYMLYFDHRNRLSEVYIVGQGEPYTPPVLRKPPSRREILRSRRLFNRARPWRPSPRGAEKELTRSSVQSQVPALLQPL